MGKQWSILKSHTVKYIIKIHFYYSYYLLLLLSLLLLLLLLLLSLLLLLLLLLSLLILYRSSFKECLNCRISCLFSS